MTKTALVTGSAGFIGSHICDRLLSEGWKIIGIDDLSAGKKENFSHLYENKNFEFFESDVTNPEELKKNIPKEIDCIFHEAGKKMAFSDKNPREDLLTNIYGTLNMLMFAQEIKAKRFIFASTIAVYGNPEKIPATEESPLIPTTPYGVSKMACEEYCRLWFKRYNLPTIILRYGSVFGPRQALNVGAAPIFISKIMNNEPITMFGDGSNTRPFTYVGDVVKAN